MESVNRQLERHYENNPIGRGLAQLCTVTAIADAALAAYLAQIHQERWQILLGELRSGAELTEDDIKSEPFVQGFILTMTASLRTPRHEKIAWFGRLLLATTGAKPGLTPGDEHEEFLRVLDELSYREIGILTILMEFEEANRNEEELRTPDYWEDFKQALVERLSLEPSELHGMIVRLGGTGLYTIHTGVYGGNNEWGQLTPQFYRLAHLIHLEGHSFVP